MVFPVVMYGCESWTIKKVERQRIDAFELWCWRRLLRVPLTVWKSNQSILKEISPDIHWTDWCWSWNCNTLATWCEDLTHLIRPWWLGKNEGRRRRGWQRMRWLDGITYSMDMSLKDSGGQRSLACCSPWSCKVGHNLVTEQQQKSIWLKSMPFLSHT